jgi:putative spermidine/putrescine transport system ATP-binding protein
MSAIALRALTKRFGSVVAVDRLHLDGRDGELLALLGPSGCGKTTTLRMIAGFEVPDEGEIAFGARRVTDLLPEERNIGMVFQNYALFPHMSVHDNVAFGLQMRKVAPADVRARVAATLAKVQLTGLEARYPRQLSGGQQQRAALARALVISPDVLLLDEPLANLDAKLREEMRFYVRSLQQEVGITTVYVTHDQAEAMVIADRIAVMFGGSIHQLSSPKDIYHRPATWMVAEFIGLTNFIEGTVSGQEGPFLVLDTALGPLRCQGTPPQADAKRARLLAVRPEAIHLTGAPSGDAQRNRLEGVVKAQAFLGNVVDYRIEVAPGIVLRVQGDPHAPFAAGDRVHVAFSPGSTWSVPPREEVAAA